MMLKKIRLKINNIKNWLWFIFVLRCNEFHHKLNLNAKAILADKISIDDDSRRIVRERKIAHELDEIWFDTKLVKCYFKLKSRFKK